MPSTKFRLISISVLLCLLACGEAEHPDTRLKKDSKVSSDSSNFYYQQTYTTGFYRKKDNLALTVLGLQWTPAGPKPLEKRENVEVAFVTDTPSVGGHLHVKGLKWSSSLEIGLTNQDLQIVQAASEQSLLEFIWAPVDADLKTVRLFIRSFPVKPPSEVNMGSVGGLTLIVLEKNETGYEFKSFAVAKRNYMGLLPNFDLEKELSFFPADSLQPLLQNDN